MICSTLLVTSVMDVATVIPSIMTYYIAVFVMTGVCMVLTFLLDMIYNNSGMDSPPAPINQLCTWLGCLTCVKASQFTERCEVSETVDLRAERRTQWKAMATVLSRLCFVVFLFIDIIITLVIFS